MAVQCRLQDQRRWLSACSRWFIKILPAARSAGLAQASTPMGSLIVCGLLSDRPQRVDAGGFGRNVIKNICCERVIILQGTTLQRIHNPGPRMGHAGGLVACKGGEGGVLRTGKQHANLTTRGGRLCNSGCSAQKCQRGENSNGEAGHGSGFQFGLRRCFAGDPQYCRGKDVVLRRRRR